MNLIPINERILLESLLGFNQLLEEEKERLVVKEFNYSDNPHLFTSGLLFVYTNKNKRESKLKFEVAGNRQEDHFYRHVLYLDIDEEIEYPGFREAIDYCNSLEALGFEPSLLKNSNELWS